MTQRPTINDVAALSGVSKSTVSNVTRGVGAVAPATRERVLAAIETLRYRPNAVARHLVQQSTNVIGVVVGNLANPFYAELVRLMEQQVSGMDYTTAICNTGGHAGLETARMGTLLEQRVSGVVMLEFSGDHSVMAEMLAERIPTVMVSCWADVVDSVAVDDSMGVALAVDHLVELGHRRFLHVSDVKLEPGTRNSRMEALSRALLRHGLEALDEPIALGGDNSLERPDALRRAVEGSPRATAVVAVNDFTALRTLDALEAFGKRVPEDVSVVGFDGIGVGGLSRLSLTTVAQPQEQLASVGIAMLSERIRHGYVTPVRHERLEPTLVVRGSTGSPSR